MDVNLHGPKNTAKRLAVQLIFSLMMTDTNVDELYFFLSLAFILREFAIVSFHSNLFYPPFDFPATQNDFPQLHVGSQDSAVSTLTRLRAGRLRIKFDSRYVEEIIRVELQLHFTIRLHGLVLNLRRAKSNLPVLIRV
jgi:hypothetical protein